MVIAKLLLGGFFIAHGLIHICYGIPAPDENWPFSLNHSWLLSRFQISQGFLRVFGMILWITATAGFIGAGLGVFGIPLMVQWWRPIATVSSVVSFLLIGIFWHRWFIVGLLLDVVVFLALVWGQWPPTTLVGS